MYNTTQKNSCLCLIPETHLSRWALFWRPRFVLKPDHPQPPKRVCVCVCIYIGSFHFSFSLLSAASITHKQLEKKPTYYFTHLVRPFPREIVVVRWNEGASLFSMSRLLLERAPTRSSQESRRKAVFVMTPLGSHNIVIELRPFKNIFFSIGQQQLEINIWFRPASAF